VLHPGDIVFAVKSPRRSIHVLFVLALSLAAALLPLGAGLGPRPTGKAITQRSDGFLPSKHGFEFRNVFRGSPLPALLRNAESGPLRAMRAGVDAGLPSEYGLCGGMSLAAADFYLSRATPIQTTTPPVLDTPLYEYLYQRQTDSMGQWGVMAMKFWKWMSLPDRSKAGESTANLSAAELPVIIARLKARQLVPVGLVFTSQADGGRIWENHQVLAYGVAERDDGVVDIRIYDPNFPKDDECVVRVTPVGKSDKPKEVVADRINGKGAVKKVRGFFAMPYQPRIPPKSLVSRQTGGTFTRSPASQK
jgi:hypothetical protein